MSNPGVIFLVDLDCSKLKSLNRFSIEDNKKPSFYTDFDFI
jgi:hypothetical protein